MCLLPLVLSLCICRAWIFFCVTIFFLHAFHSRTHSKVSPSPSLFQAGHTELFQPFLPCPLPELETACWSPPTLVPVCCHPSYPGQPKTGHRTPNVVSPVPSREEGSLPWICQLHLKPSQEAKGLFCHNPHHWLMAPGCSVGTPNFFFSAHLLPRQSTPAWMFASDSSLPGAGFMFTHSTFTGLLSAHFSTVSRAL